MRIPARKLTVLMPIIFILSLGLSAPFARAQENAPDSPSSDGQNQATDEIVQEVIKELRDSGALQEAVQEGIQEFIRRQQQAQAEARQQQQQQADRQAKNVRPVSESDHIYGNPDATISLIEYSDFECPYCKRFHPTAKKLVDESGGEINLVYRHFPLSFHNPGAHREAQASECAAELGGNDAFWAFTDAVYERTSSGGEGFPKDQIVPLGVEIGLDEAAFKECIESDRHEDRIDRDLAEGVRAGVSGTPGNILLNNETGEAMMRAGAQPLGALQDAAAQLKEGESDSDESS